jgi:hypothetical protein
LLLLVFVSSSFLKFLFVFIFVIFNGFPKIVWETPSPQGDDEDLAGYHAG